MMNQSDFTRIDERQLYESLHDHFCTIAMYADLGAQGAGLRSRISSYEAARGIKAVLRVLVDDLHELEASRAQREKEGAA